MSDRAATKGSGLSIEVDAALTLRDIRELHDGGSPVIRTPHQGNWAPYNQAPASMGIRMVVHDRTIPSQDGNYHPGSQIVRGQRVPIIEAEHNGKLTTHLRSVGPPAGLAGVIPQQFRARPGEPVVDVHMRSLRAAFPDTDIVSTSEFFLRNDARSYDMLRAIAANDLGSWRHVDENGAVSTPEGLPSDLVAKYGIFKDGSERGERSGMLPPVTATVAAMTVCDALDYGSDTVFHLSGPDMAKYVTKPAIVSEIQQMYSAVRRLRGVRGRLPGDLKLRVIPATAAKLVVPESKRSEVDALLITRAALAAAGRDKLSAETHRAEMETLHKDALRSGDPDAKAILAAVVARKDAAHREGLKLDPQLTAFARACSRLFLKTESAAYPTQYDLLASGEGIYIHPLVYETPMDELASINEELADRSRRRK